MRILDYLNSDDEDADVTACHGHNCRRILSMEKFRRWRPRIREEGSRNDVGKECLASTPRKVILQLLSRFSQCRGERERKIDDRREDGGFSGGYGGESPARVAQACNGASREDDSSGCERREMTFNLAVGLGLLSLVARAKSELDKTAESRKQIEFFLRTAKEAWRSKDIISNPLEAENAYVTSTRLDGLSNVSLLSFEDHETPMSHPESNITMVCDRFSNCNAIEKDECIEEIQHLEVELQAELERLELSLETGGSSENTQRSTNDKRIPSLELDARTLSVSSECVIVDTKDAGDRMQHVVSAVELERRLHEVLEARQEERIRKLEADLECVKQKLEEKEMEISWWKDTVNLISKHVPESSRYLRHAYTDS